MTRPSHHALLLALGLACTTVHVAASAAGSRDEAQQQAIRQDDSFQQELIAAAEQALSGDTLGATIAYDRLLADPRMDSVELRARSVAWLMGAHVAARQRHEALALQRLDVSLQVDPHNALARLALAQDQIFKEQLDAGVDNLIQGIGDTDGVPELDAGFVHALSTRLKGDPTRRLALLQSLFDRQWTIEGVEPMEMWAILATLQVEAGQRDKVIATLERIDAPLTLVTLRSDKRFDPYMRRDDPRFDPVAAARRRIDQLRVDTMLSPGLNQIASELSYSLLVAGELEEVVGMTQPLEEITVDLESGPAGEGEHIAWLLDHRAIALRRLGRFDEAVATRVLAARMADPARDSVSQALNLGTLYVGLHRPALARQAIEDLGSLSSYGEGVRQLIALRAAVQLNDIAAADAARQALQAQREANPVIYRQALLIDNRMDEAAASLIGQLQDPMERGSALRDLQDMREGAPLPANVELDARYKELAHRADVQAALNKVGRIDHYPLFGT